MQAVILAAGMGRRLRELTKHNTKCMVKVNGIPLIDRMLHQIEKKNFSRIIIVVGYEGQKLIDYIGTLDIVTPISFVNNPIYDKTNNIYSLALTKDFLCEEDTILFESDIIFEDRVLDLLVDDPRSTLTLVAKYESWMNGTCVKINDEGEIIDFITGKKFNFAETDEYYKTVNIYKFSKHFSKTSYVPFLEAYQEALGVNEYYEQVLRVITMLDNSEIRAKCLTSELWYEIDDIQDLDIAESMFVEDDNKKVSMLSERYGGYWRYPNLIDFCYLVNPYYPPKTLIDELKASFEALITQYPSGMKVNSMLAAKNFDVHEENIVVGNGASELIKALVERMTGKLGVIRPTFEEYGNRYDKESIVSFWPTNDSYQYTVQDIIRFFDDKNINNLILINPDNPSGNYISKAGVFELISWTKRKHITLVVDESFCDFADEDNNSLFDLKMLEKNKHVFVIKSISKSFGVPGIRLGVLASGDVSKIMELKKDVAIWNINSLGEYYLQIAEKYRKDYENALIKCRKERIRCIYELSRISGIRVIPSQANFVMIQITSGITASELTKMLIKKHNFFIKDLSHKLDKTDKQYIRIAIRNTEDNNKLISALKEELL